MTKTPRLRTSKKLRTPDLIYLFDVTHMTLKNWRDGAARKTRPLPCHIDEEGHVTFVPASIRAWAKENGLTLKQDPVDYAINGKPSKKRPGPKPRAVDTAHGKEVHHPPEVEPVAPTEREKGRDVAPIESKHTSKKEDKPLGHLVARTRLTAPVAKPRASI